MIDTSSFIVRTSGKSVGQYYIDYVGMYRPADISRAAGVDEVTLAGIYRANGGLFDDVQGIFYFDSAIAAQKTISDIFERMPRQNRGRLIAFTEAEIAYIRKALINDGSGFAGVDAGVKAGIFKKLNG